MRLHKRIASKLRWLAALALLWPTLTVCGQSDGRMRQYMFSQLDFNPAFAGSQGLINLWAMGRQQWVGFGPGAPRTIMFSGDIPFNYRALSQMKPGKKFQISHGLGLHFVRDEIGFSALNAVELSYALRFHIRATGSLSIGVGFRALNDRFKATWRSVSGNVDSDPAIPAPNASSVTVDLSAGAYFNTTSMFFGLSFQNLLGTEIRGLIIPLKNHGRLDYARQMYLVCGYNAGLPKNWSVEPSLLFRTDFAQLSLDISTLVKYNNRFWFGVSYQVLESVGVMAGVNVLDGLKIGYSFDYPTTAIRKYAPAGSHEVVIGYSFSLVRDKVPLRYKSIRYL